MKLPSLDHHHSNISPESTLTETARDLSQWMDQGNLWQGHQTPNLTRPVMSTGYAELDKELPGGGWQAGRVCEMYHQGMGAGELTLLLPALAALSQQSRWVLWVAPPARPFAPALAQAGIEVNHMLMVHPRSYKEAIWCMEEAMRSGHCSAVLGWLWEWRKSHIRRLQLAATEQNCHCWLWPQTGYDPSGSPAAFRLKVGRPVEMAQRQTHLQVELLKRRGRWPGKPFLLDTRTRHSA